MTTAIHLETAAKKEMYCGGFPFQTVNLQRNSDEILHFPYFTTTTFSKNWNICVLDYISRKKIQSSGAHRCGFARN